MLQRIVHDNGLITYQSPLLRQIGVPHAFSTRVGGISRDPFATLNLAVGEKISGGDAPTNIAENFRRLRRAIGAERYIRIEAKQVHGADVWVAPETPVRLREAPCADAIVTDLPGRLLTVRVADCVPVLLSDSSGTKVGVVHVGWRGVIGRVVQAATEKLVKQFCCLPHDLNAAIGPCIGREHFEVGPDVAQEFDQASLGVTVIASPGTRPRLDLAGAVAIQLEVSGLNRLQIDRTDRCTYRDADEFFSHRRDRGVTGRMAAVIARKGGVSNS